MARLLHALLLLASAHGAPHRVRRELPPSGGPTPRPPTPRPTPRPVAAPDPTAAPTKAFVELDWVDQWSSDDKAAFYDPALAVKVVWSGTHNVHELASAEAWDECDFTGAAELGGSSGVELTGSEGDVKYYACAVGSHCATGQKIAITWSEHGFLPSYAPTSEPTPEPTPAPTLEPTKRPAPSPTSRPSAFPGDPTAAPVPSPTPRPAPRPTAPSPSSRPSAFPGDPTAAPVRPPTPRPYPRPTAPAPTAGPTPACERIVESATADLLKAEYESVEDAYDKDAHGHATYDCAAELVDEHAQYDKAEPYLWCVIAHCEECDGTAGAACPTASVGLYERDECESAVFNYLGFVSRKKDEPDFESAEEYYREALELWPENCDHQRPAAATIFESF